ncbi:MAG: hypothetical protein ACREQM_12010 [Candidatus Dormibacteraceae bacterium]
MSEALFWQFVGGLLCLLGAVSLLTAGWLRLRRQACLVPLLNGVAGLGVGLVLAAVVR